MGFFFFVKYTPLQGVFAFAKDTTAILGGDKMNKHLGEKISKWRKYQYRLGCLWVL